MDTPIVVALIALAGTIVMAICTVIAAYMGAKPKPESIPPDPVSKPTKLLGPEVKPPKTFQNADLYGTWLWREPNGVENQIYFPEEDDGAWTAASEPGYGPFGLIKHSSGYWKLYNNPQTKFSRISMTQTHYGAVRWWECSEPGEWIKQDIESLTATKIEFGDGTFWERVEE